MSIIAVGGNSWPDLVKSTELLDAGSLTWRYGPPLPVVIQGSALVEDPKGGVILIGGIETQSNLPTSKMYRLRHAMDVWEEMPRTLKSARYKPIAFRVPDSMTSCTRV